MGLQSEKAVAQAGAFQQSLNVLGRTAKVTGQDIGVAFAPLGVVVDKVFINIIDRGEALVKTVGTAIIDVLANLAEYARGVGIIFLDAVTGQFAKIPDAWTETKSRLLSDNKEAGALIAGYWKTASDAIAASFKAMAIEPPKVPQGGGGTGGGFHGDNSAALKKAALDKFETLRAELALELAEINKNIDAKMALEQAFVEKVRAIRNLPLKDLISAFAEEQRAWETYLGAKLKLNLDDATNTQTVAKAALTLQQAQDAQGLAAATAAARNRLASAMESKQQELADLISIGNQEVAAEQTVENQRFENLRSELLRKLTALQQSGLDEREEINKTNAAMQALESEHQAKLLSIATKGETEQGKQVAQIAAANLKDQATLFNSFLEPIASGFDAMFDGVIRGTQKVSDAFRKMGEDLLLSIAKSGLKDLLLGGSSGSVGASIFGEAGKGGGIAGIIASTFGGPAVSGALTKALTTAFTAAQSFIANVFKGALQGIGSLLGGGAGAASTAVSAATSGAGQAQAFKDALSPIQMLLQTHVAQAIIQTGIMFSHLGVATTHAATAVLHLAQAFIHNIWLALIAVYNAIAATPSVLGFHAAGGAIIPSARGGMLSGGGFPAILHPKEMVLPAPISEGMQGLFNGRGRGSSSSNSAQQGAGGGQMPAINVSYTINAIDSRGVKEVLRQHQDTITEIVTNHAIRYGSLYKRRVG
jgi:hypothetical protein